MKLYHGNLSRTVLLWLAAVSKGFSQVNSVLSALSGVQALWSHRYRFGVTDCLCFFFPSPIIIVIIFIIIFLLLYQNGTITYKHGYSSACDFGSLFIQLVFSYIFYCSLLIKRPLKYLNKIYRNPNFLYEHNRKKSIVYGK